MTKKLLFGFALLLVLLSNTFPVEAAYTSYYQYGDYRANYVRGPTNPGTWPYGYSGLQYAPGYWSRGPAAYDYFPSQWIGYQKEYWPVTSYSVPRNARDPWQTYYDSHHVSAINSYKANWYGTGYRPWWP